MENFLLMILWLLVAYTKQIAIAVGAGCIFAYCVAVILSTLFMAAGSRRR